MSDTDTTGGPAFPVLHEGTTRPEAFGMTLRDYFAAKAMAALIVAAPRLDAIRYAEGAYGIADAMLEARNG